MSPLRQFALSGLLIQAACAGANTPGALDASVPSCCQGKDGGTPDAAVQYDAGEVSGDAGVPDAGDPVDAGRCSACSPQERCTSVGCTVECATCSSALPCADGGVCVLDFLGEGACVFPAAPCTPNESDTEVIEIHLMNGPGCPARREAEVCETIHLLDLDAGMIQIIGRWQLAGGDEGEQPLGELSLQGDLRDEWTAASPTLWCLDPELLRGSSCAYHADHIRLIARGGGRQVEFLYQMYSARPPPQVVRTAITSIMKRTGHIRIDAGFP